MDATDSQAVRGRVQAAGRGLQADWTAAKTSLNPTAFRRWTKLPPRVSRRDEMDRVRTEGPAYSAHSLKQIMLESQHVLAAIHPLYMDIWKCGPAIYDISKKQQEAATDARRKPTEGGTLLEYPFGRMVAAANDILGEPLLNYPKVQFAVQLCSGRRSEEICNPEYTFIPHPDDEQKVIISSLAKKMPGRKHKVDVPVLLLCNRDLWFAALKCLRENMRAYPADALTTWLQRPTSPFIDFDTALRARYQRGFGSHQLRHIYCAYTAAVRKTNFYTENANELLSHSSMLTSMFYANMVCTFEGTEADSEGEGKSDSEGAGKPDSEGEGKPAAKRPRTA
ncbi:hypothetical protein JKP88DRAFT_242411 [Tribonema minus]|uniref:Uncharacterized protein n=1 Tax=Tribonema minus TaxID=303371 RepID=A0A836C7I4_9STRA|nr:hypothetical protein JKP88DRAFT_242411 [Tribonema minus]